jgi:DNA helicase-2/ATP-dependent DNA helicase PcrA
LPRSVFDSWREFASLISDLLAPETMDAAGKQIEMILERGYEGYVQTSFENSEARLEELRQLANFAAQFKTTSDFLSELALINTERFAPPGATIGTDVVTGDYEDERLTLSSVHQAKGLEWKAVFLIWAADGRFPSARSLRDPEGEEEERRLFYVALTRTKDELYVCYPLIENNRARQTLIQRPSRFVTEVPRALFEIWSVEDELPSLEADDQGLVN